MTIQIPTITTARLTLRPFHMEDAPDLHRIMNEPDINQYFPTTAPPALEKVERMIAHQLEHWVEFQRGWWAVIQNGSLIGWNGLYYLAETDETEVGYLLSRAHWGQGFGTESTRAALEYGFNVLGLEQVIGLTHPDNIASQKVLLNSGLRFIQRQNYFGMEMCKFRISRS